MKNITLKSILKTNGGKKKFASRIAKAIKLSNKFFDYDGDSSHLTWEDCGSSFASGGYGPAIYLNGNQFITLCEFDDENVGIYCDNDGCEGDCGEIVDNVDYDTAEKLLEEIYEFIEYEIC